GVAVPAEMNGEPIRSDAASDPGAVRDRSDRMTAVAERRAPVIVVCLLAWLGVATLLALLWPAGPGRAGALRTAAAWFGLAVAWRPAGLLVGAALAPGALGEGLLTGLGSAGLAGLTVALVPGWWALAVACAATGLAYAIDVIAGSSLTALSLLGPNPVFGIRFYGIGNELEAILAVLVPVGVGAGLTAAAARGPVSRRTAIAAFLIAGIVAGAIFAAGRFGADVGAAIGLPAGPPGGGRVRPPPVPAHPHR